MASAPTKTKRPSKTPAAQPRKLAVPDDVSRYRACAPGGFELVASASILNGVPQQRFRKAIIKAGEYVKGDQQIEVTSETLNNWVAQFHAMKLAGVRVSIPTGHAADGNADENNGWVDDLFLDGDTLVMTCTMIGEDAILAASRSDVSIYSPPKFTDGKGRTYPQPILHVALCTDPVVPGLGEFIPIQFSRTLRMSTMNPLEYLQTIASALGIATPITAENYEALITPALNACIDKAKGETPDPAAAPASAGGGGLPKAPGDPSGMGGANAANAPGHIKRITTEYAASRGAVETPNPMLVKLAADNRRMKIDGLFKDGKITAAVRDKMIARHIGAKNEAVTLSLSRGDDGTDFDADIALWRENDPVALKREARGTTVVLSHPNNSDGKSPLVKNAEERAKAASGAK